MAPLSPRARRGGPARWQRHRWWWLLLLAVLEGNASLRAASTTDRPPTEYEVKAAYLYYLAMFIEWPAGATGDELVIGVVGIDPFGPMLDQTVQGKAVQNGKSLVVRRFADLKDVARAHILFIGSSEAEHLPEILNVLEGSSTLTVGDMGRFAQRGGMVALKLEGNKVRFDINLGAARKAGLTLSSQLLKLANIVGDARGASR